MKTKLLLCSLAFAGVQAMSNLSAQNCQAGFTFSVNNNVVTFTNTSTGGNQPAYSWDFGDGYYDYTFNATHTYMYAGTYPVCLYVSTQDSLCSSYFCDSVVITNAPTPPCHVYAYGDTIINSGNSSTLSAFFNNSGNTNCTNGSFSWSTGATTASIVVAPTVTTSYTVVGYCASTNCSATSVVTVVVYPPCNLLAGFTFNSSGDPQIAFTNTSTGSSAPYYSWDFGDGNYSSSANPTHAYQYNGTYLVCLDAWDSLQQNCYSGFCDTIVITNAAAQPCHALFYAYPDSNQLQNSVSFWDVSTGGPTSWSWSFGDGSSSTLQNPVHQYAQAGSYAVCLTITTSSGTCTYCDTVNTHNITNTCNLAAGFTFNSANDPQITFTNTSTSTSAPYYFWNFGDGNYSSSVNPTHTYQHNGTYLVCLDVWDSLYQQCYSGYCDTIVITNAAPPLACSVSIYLYPDSQNTASSGWHAYSVVTGTGPFTYLWDFGDGSTSAQPYPSHTYATPGHYVICLTITDATGCSSATCDSTYKMTSSGIIGSLVVVNPLAGIDENSVSVNAVFPNPANDLIEVSLSQLVKGDLTITDMLGREVYQEKINTNNVRVNVSTLPIGCYNLSIASGTKTAHNRILIAR